MLNNISNKERLLIIKDLIEYAEKKGLDKNFFEQVLKTLLPNDNEKPLVNYTILEKGYSTALFIPHKEKIVISIDKMKKWLDDNTNDLKEVYLL